MFGRRYLGGRYFGGRYWGDGGNLIPAGITAAQIWGHVLSNGKTAAATLLETHVMVRELWREHGLDIAVPLVVSPTSRVAGTQTQTITEVGSTVTVQRT